MVHSEKTPTTYFMATKNNSVLYVGVTSDLMGRVWAHKNEKYLNAFTSKYQCFKLVFYEDFPTMNEAIAFEKRVKNWKREWKDDLIDKHNPEWKDLSAGWYE